MFQLDLIKKEKFYGLLLLFFVISQLLPTVIFSFNSHQLPSYFLSEDGIYESMSAIFCLLASIVFLYSFLKFPRRVDYFLFSLNRNMTALLFSVLLFLLFAEEISWGQRILNIKTPEIISEINFQKELTIHNLKIFQTKNNAISDMLSKLLIFYLFVLPLFIHCFSFTKNIVDRLGIPIASLQIALIVVIVRQINRFNYWIFYQDQYIVDHYHIGEAYESNIEMLLFVLSLEYLYSCRNKFVNLA